MTQERGHASGMHSKLFGTVPEHDYLGFWPRGTFDALRVVRFLEFTKIDVARIARVATASVRFDQKIPKNVLDRLTEIATVCGLVAQFFGGDLRRTSLWFKTKNPILGDVSPQDMILRDRFDGLRTFVLEALAAASGPVASTSGVSTGEGALPTGGIKTGREHPLIAIHCDEIAALCRRYGIQKLALFGSILRPDFDPQRSDIDVVVEFFPHEGTSLARQYFDFKAALEQLLSRPVDLVELSAMPDSRLRRIIERTQEPLYAEAA